jgi:hypothetical protein
MRWHCFVWIVLVGLMGCARQKVEPWAHPAPSEAAPKPSMVIVTPTDTRAGKITSVNATVRYVVITYPVGVPLPTPERQLNVYRAGLKVAEVKVGGDNPRERRDVNLAADIIAGECKVGDEVREN